MTVNKYKIKMLKDAEILFLFLILVIDISALSFDIFAPKMLKYPHPLFFISCSLCLLN